MSYDEVPYRQSQKLERRGLIRVYRSAGGENFGVFMGNNIEKRVLIRSRLYGSTQSISPNLNLTFSIYLKKTLLFQFTPKKPHFFKVPQDFRKQPSRQGGLGLTYVSGNFGVNTPMIRGISSGNTPPNAAFFSKCWGLNH